jgi:DNA-binding SARP family transcriptional activator
MRNLNSDMNISPIAPYFRVWSCGLFRVEAQRGTAPVLYEPVRTAEWGGSNYPRLLLKALLCCPGRQARREVLIEMLWSQCEAGQASQNLNTGATKLRSLLRPGKEQESLLITEKNASSYSLEGQRFLWVDIDAVTALLKGAEQVERTSAQALPLLEEAAKYLDRGTFLEGEEGWWVQKQRKSVKETRYRCRLWLAEAYEQQGMVGQAETLLSALLADDPTDEDVLRRLLVFLHQRQMIHKGRRLYEETKRLLQNQNLQLSQTMITFAERLLNTPPTEGVSPVS